MMPATDLDIERWVEQQYGFVPHPFWIADCKQLYLLTAVESEGPRKPWHECPREKRAPIRQALIHFGLLPDEQRALAAGASVRR